MTTISPFSLSLPYRTENRRFSTLSCTKTGSTQPKLSAACFVVQSCLADADFVVFSNYCLIGTRQKAGSFCRPLQKARRVCVRRRKKFQSFSPAACTAEKIHFGSQTCELCADGAQLVRCSEPQSLQTRAQRSGSRLSACQNAFWPRDHVCGCFLISNRHTATT